VVVVAQSPATKHLSQRGFYDKLGMLGDIRSRLVEDRHCKPFSEQEL
jgi:hypothetical protein